MLAPGFLAISKRTPQILVAMSKAGREGGSAPQFPLFQPSAGDPNGCGSFSYGLMAIGK